MNKGEEERRCDVAAGSVSTEQPSSARATFGNDNGGGVAADSKKSALALPARTRASPKGRMRKTRRGNDQDVRWRAINLIAEHVFLRKNFYNYAIKCIKKVVAEGVQEE